MTLPPSSAPVFNLGPLPEEPPAESVDTTDTHTPAASSPGDTEGGES